MTERKRAEECQRALVAELDHRVKNALATVCSVVSQTAVGNGSVVNFVAALDGRIRSMATTHELLSAGRWRGISLTELIQRELAPYATPSNVDINGPEIVLHAEAQWQWCSTSWLRMLQSTGPSLPGMGACRFGGIIGRTGTHVLI